jgi:hypothetical protein
MIRPGPALTERIGRHGVRWDRYPGQPQSFERPCSSARQRQHRARRAEAHVFELAAQHGIDPADIDQQDLARLLTTVLERASRPR